MMQCWDKKGGRMVYSSCIHPFQLETKWQERRRRKYEMRLMFAPDYTLLTTVISCVSFVAFCVMFVRWWLCV